MNNTGANYHAILINTGVKTLGDLGDGITASTVHKIVCLTAGAIDITPMLGDKFTFTANATQSIEIVPREIKWTSGTFIAIKSKFYPRQNTNLYAQGTAV